MQKKYIPREIFNKTLKMSTGKNHYLTGIVMFSISIFLVASSVLADDQPTTWVRGNLRYTRVGNGVSISLVDPSLKIQPNKENTPQMQNSQPGLQPQFLDVVSVSSIADINVATGTDLTSVNLPKKITETMSDKSTKFSPVLWDSGTPTYDGNTPGTYVFSGTPVLSGKFTNTKSIKATINVVVGSQTATPTPTENASTSQSLNISSVAPISEIDVAYGTDIASVNLPTTITTTLSDASTQNITVAWDNGTPTYDANTAGTYVFSGTLTLPDNITNTNNLTASVNVTILAQSATPPDNSLLQTTSPSTGSDIIQQTTAGLLNGINNFFNFIFSPFKKLFKIK